MWVIGSSGIDFWKFKVFLNVQMTQTKYYNVETITNSDCLTS